MRLPLETRLPLAYARDMTPSRADIVEWLRAELAKEIPGKNQSQLAKFLGKDRSAITRILKGRQDISVTDHAMMREFFGATTQKLVQEPVEGVRMVGTIGDHVWLAQTDDSPSYVGAVSSEYDISEQSAFKLFEATPDGEFLVGDVIYTVPFDKYRQRPLKGDLIVTRTERDGLERYSLREAAVVGATLKLVRLGDHSVPSEKEEPLGLMIGFYRPLRQR